MNKLLQYLCFINFGIFSVIIFPNSLKTNIICIPFDGWAFIHLLSTFSFAYIYRPNIRYYWFVVFSWELIEKILSNITIYSLNNIFNEDLNDMLSDILIAIPGSLIL